MKQNEITLNGLLYIYLYIYICLENVLITTMTAVYYRPLKRYLLFSELGVGYPHLLHRVVRSGQHVDTRWSIGAVGHRSKYRA